MAPQMRPVESVVLVVEEMATRKQVVLERLGKEMQVVLLTIIHQDVIMVVAVLAAVLALLGQTPFVIQPRMVETVLMILLMSLGLLKRKH